MKPDPEGEEFAKQRIAYRLVLIEQLEQHLGGQFFDLAAPDSELAIDDERLQPFNTSHYVAHCLGLGLDAFRTLRFVLQDPTNANVLRVPMAGCYPLTRTALEAAAVAVYLLQPDDPSERLERSLQVRWSDALFDNQLLLASTREWEKDDKPGRALKAKVRKVNSQRHRERKNELRKIAEAVGVLVSDVERGRPGLGDVVEGAAPVIGMEPGHVRAPWHIMSGLTHPSASRSASFSILRVMGDADGTGDVKRVEVTASLSILNLALEAAMLMHITALSLAAQRGGRPEVEWRAAPGTPLPPQRASSR